MSSFRTRTLQRYPLVSCIMPTQNRRRFLPLAIQYFFRQNYPLKELVIVDDGEDNIRDVVPHNDAIRYLSLDTPHTIGTKRNIAIEASCGDVILHWDDDDWFAANRIALQVQSVTAHEHCFCGLETMIFLDIQHEQAWLYKCLAPSKPWLAGGSLCYFRYLWQKHPFDDLTYGEDTQFLWSRENIEVFPMSHFAFYVAMIHPSNTICKNVTSSNYWKCYPLQECQKIMGADYFCYIKTTRRS